MVDSFSNMTLSTELSYDDFIETYGRIRSNSASSGKHECWESDNHSTSTGSFSTVVEATQIDCDGVESDNEINAVNGQKDEVNVEKKEEIQEDMDKLPEYPAGTRRRNSKFSNMATRLARKSFRMVKKKTATEDSNPDQPKAKSRPNTPAKWNKLFKRNQNASKQLEELKSFSLRSSASDEDHVPYMTSEATSSPRRSRPPLGRSSSHSLLLTSCNKSTPETRRKSSSLNTQKPDIEIPESESQTNSNLQEATNENVQNCHPISSGPPEPKPCTPEYDIMKKYEEIREEEELRRIAIVTLLKRRKNSLKIKCDQFDKDLLEGNIEDDTFKIIRSRLKHMKRKLKVVEQCIEEQTEAIKAHSAKILLQQNLKLYQLDLLREERNGYSRCLQKTKNDKKMKTKNHSSSFASCETLESVDETCIFDDTSSITSLEHKDNNLSSPLALYDRRSSSTCGCGTPTSILQKENTTSVGELRRERRSSGRSQSIDLAVTSDCDSGFGNGDVLSRSDVSLDRSFSKSTGSIASSSSRGTVHLSGSIQGSTSPQEIQKHHYFFSPSTSSSEQSLHKSKVLKNTSTKQNKSSQHEIDASVLATIEDFEKFAERTKRRLSNKGKLVPLKKGC